jgi:dipeptidyl aminopeptidase/acylaminoacyl peptidase
MQVVPIRRRPTLTLGSPMPRFRFRPWRVVAAARPLLLAATLASLSCSDPGTGPLPEEEVGALRLFAIITGNGSIHEGLSASVLGTEHRFAVHDTLRLEGLPPGELTIRIGGVPTHCTTQAESILVHVESGRVTNVELAAECYGEILFREWYGPFRSQLFFMDRYGVPRKLTPQMPGGQWSPKWSPDGTRVLFEKHSEDDVDLYVAHLDGELRPIAVRSGDQESGGTWSPDGEWVAYVLVQGMGQFRRSDLRLVRADGSEDHSILDDGGIALSPAWSPDGSYIAFGCWRGEHGICYVTPEGTLLGSAPAAVESPQHLSWSPDGSRIAFMDFFEGRQGIRILSVVGGEAVRVMAPEPVTYGTPRWSPDGSRLAVSTARDGEYGLSLVDADGTNPRAIASHGVRSSGAWSPDGTMFSLVLSPWSVNIRGTSTSSDRVLITRSAELIAGPWRPARPSAMQGITAASRHADTPAVRPAAGWTGTESPIRTAHLNRPEGTETVLCDGPAPNRR